MYIGKMELLSRNFPVGTTENHEELQSGYPSRVMNQRIAEYEVAILTPSPARLSMMYRCR
jgi:hypothetical protein